MSSTECCVLLKKDEYTQIKENIKNLQLKIQKLENKIETIENQNILSDILYLFNKYWEYFWLSILDKIIDVPAE